MWMAFGGEYEIVVDKRITHEKARRWTCSAEQGPQETNHTAYIKYPALLNFYCKNANRYYLCAVYIRRKELLLLRCKLKKIYKRTPMLKKTTIDELNAINFKDFVVASFLYKKLSYIPLQELHKLFSLIKQTTRRLNNLSQAITMTVATSVNIYLRHIICNAGLAHLTTELQRK